MANFILSTANTGFIPFASSVQASSPRSEGNSSTSSYDDGPAENARTDKFPVVEHRMYVINRGGSGEASYLLLTEDARAILSYRVHSETWRPIEGVLNFGVIALDSWIYVIGGFDRNLATALKRVIRYDPREGNWEACKDMIAPRSRFGVCVVGGKIWVCGGERSDGKITASCEVYDPKENEWVKGGMLLEPRASPACVGYGSDLLCAGGFYNGTVHNNLWMFDEHHWQELDEHYPHKLPYCLDKCAVAANENTFYFLGGVTTVDNTLKGSKDKKRKKSQHHPGALSNQAYAGTTSSSNNSSLVESSKDKNAKDTTDRNSNQQNKNNRSEMVLDVRKNKSNKNGDSDLSTSTTKSTGVHVSKSIHNDSNGAGAIAPSKPRFGTERRVFSFATSIHAGEKTQSLDIISPWNLKLPPMIHARHSAGAVSIGTKIHVVGGTCVETGQAVNMSEHFDLMTGEWEEDFTLRRFDVSSVCCVVIGLPKVPFKERKSVVKLKWVMW